MLTQGTLRNQRANCRQTGQLWMEPGLELKYGCNIHTHVWEKEKVSLGNERNFISWRAGREMVTSPSYRGSNMAGDQGWGKVAKKPWLFKMLLFSNSLTSL